MAYGLECRDAAGNLTYSTADTTWSLIAVHTAPANSNASFTGITVYPERLVVRLMINQLTGDDEAYVHTYSMGATSTTLAATAPDTANTVETLFMIFGR